MADITDSFAKIQIEGTRFRKPISEALLQAIGGAINALLNWREDEQLPFNDYVEEKLIPVGTVFQTMLSEVQFTAENGSRWVRADGRSVAGSRYHTVTGQTNVPDLRGYFIRASADDTSVDPGGPRGIGGVQTSSNLPHTHNISFNPKITRDKTTPSEPTVTQTQLTWLEDTRVSGGSFSNTGDVEGDNDPSVGQGPNGHDGPWFTKRFRRFDATLPSATGSSGIAESRPINRSLTFMIKIN